MFELNFSKMVINCPKFPDEVFHPFMPNSVDADDAVDPVESPEHSKEDTNFETPSPPSQTTAPSVSRKGKEKMPEFRESTLTADVTSSSAPEKKRKTISASKGGKVKMTPAEIRHYYSSFEEEPIFEPAAKKFGGSRVEETLQLLFEAIEAHDESEDSDVAITKEVRTGNTRTIKCMAQAAKQRPGLRRTS